MPLYRLPSYYDVVQKFGRTPDMDAANTNEEVWDGSGAYVFPPAAATMTISSESANDDGAPAGTGARTVKVYGLDTNWQVVSETLTMNGTAGVTIGTDLLRVYRAQVETVGSVGTNDDNIWIGTGSITAGVPDTVYAGILGGNGQTLMAIYTVPALNSDGVAYSGGLVTKWYGTIGAAQSAFATIALQTRTDGRAWRTRGVAGISEGGYFEEQIDWGLDLPVKTDIRVRALTNGANNSAIESGFDVLLYY